MKPQLNLQLSQIDSKKKERRRNRDECGTGAIFCQRSSFEATVPCPFIYFKICAPLKRILKLAITLKIIKNFARGIFFSGEKFHFPQNMFFPLSCHLTCVGGIMMKMSPKRQLEAKSYQLDRYAGLCSPQCSNSTVNVGPSPNIRSIKGRRGDIPYRYWQASKLQILVLIGYTVQQSSACLNVKGCVLFQNLLPNYCTNGKVKL